MAPAARRRPRERASTASWSPAPAAIAHPRCGGTGQSKGRDCPGDRDRAKTPSLWPELSRNGRKLPKNASLRPRLHRHEIPANKPNSGLASAWIAPRRPPVRVRLAPSENPVVMRVLTRPAGSRRPLASDSLARSLARSPPCASRPRHEKPHLKPFRRYERLRPGDSIELHLGAPTFEFSTASTPQRAPPFSPEETRAEGCAVSALSLLH